MDGSNFYESDVNQTIHESFSIVKTIQGGSYSMEDTNLVNTKYGSFAQSLKENFKRRGDLFYLLLRYVKRGRPTIKLCNVKICLLTR